MKSLPAVTAVLLLASFGIGAQPMSMDKPGSMAASSGVSAQLTDGEVRKVDKKAAELTLRHGDLPSIGMGPMTMVFRVADAKMLDTVKVGDHVRFAAEMKGGSPTVTRMEKTR